MESIDKLREYVEDAPRTSISLMARSTLLGMARDIELEVEQLREREYQSGREDAEGAAEFADRLYRAAERREDVTLWGVDYTALPLDADGEPIHVGDVMEWPDGNTFEVRGFGGNTLFYIDGGHCEWTSVGMKRHHHAPTVEDVLRELIHRYDELRLGPNAFDPFELVETFAAKLALRGDE